jgi:hypothetical protein
MERSKIIERGDTPFGGTIKFHDGAQFHCAIVFIFD